MSFMASKWTSAQMPDLTGKIVIVTGANSGIGLAAAEELARKGAHLLLAARNEQKNQAALDKIMQDTPQAQVEVYRLDLSDIASVRSFAEAFLARNLSLDMLINNAGVMALPYRQTADGFEMQLGTNHLGHFALTGLLLPRLLAAPAARIVTISSGAHQMGKMDFANLNWENGGYHKWLAYGRSKLANLLFAFELQRRLAQMGARAISVAAHPGLAATNLQYVGPEMEESALMRNVFMIMNSMFAQSAEMGALPTLYAATAPEVQGGDYIGPGGLLKMRGYPRKVKANDAAYNEADAAKLWQVSEELTGVHYAALEMA
jgi:NAD(P)-dependent dehydrogenase (short-subunit alcohol dehydrogenase family)